MKKIFLLLLVSLLVATVVDAKLYMATQNIKVMSGKGTKYDVLGTIKRGTKFDVIDSVGKWRKVKDEDEIGYINEKFIEEAPLEVSEAPDTSVISKIKAWVNDNMISTLVGVVVLLLILKSIGLSISARRSERTAVSYDEKYKSLVKYWFQCKHCAAAIKNDAEPSSNGCAKSLHHHWTNLGEVGQHKYFCKNCSVVVHTRLAPSDHGCPQSTLHRWVQKR